MDSRLFLNGPAFIDILIADIIQIKSHIISIEYVDNTVLCIPMYMFTIYAHIERTLFSPTICLKTLL